MVFLLLFSVMGPITRPPRILVSVALPPASAATVMPPLVVPELMTMALPPANVAAARPALLPEFIAVALPPPNVAAATPVQAIPAPPPATSRQQRSAAAMPR